MNEKKSSSSVISRHGVRLIVSIVLAVAAVILFNVIADKLPSEYTSFDLTGMEAFTFTQQTEDICGALKDDITFYYIYGGNAGSDSLSAYLTSLMKRYTELTPRIKVVTIDPAKDPHFTTKYTDETVSDRSIIVDGPLRSKIVPYTEVFVYDQNEAAATGTINNLDFKGEQALTSAISYVVSEQVPVIYATKGHGEAIPDAGIRDRVLDENYELTEVDLRTVSEVPADADVLLIDCPSTDLTPAELETIYKYLDKGGNLFVITDYLDESKPNLTALMARYHMSAVDGTVIETNTSYCFGGSPTSIMPEIQYHTVTAPLYNHQKSVLVRGGQGLEIDSSSIPSSANIVSLFKTSEGSFSRVGTKGNIDAITSTAKQDGDIGGPFYFGIAGELATENDSTKIVWLSGADFNSDSASANVSGGNLDIFLNSLAWMCDWEHTISIRSAAVAGGMISPSDTQRIVWGIVYPVIFCLAIMVCGAVVWQKRRTR